MIRTTSAQPDNDAILAKRASHAAAERARRAKIKAAKSDEIPPAAPGDDDILTAAPVAPLASAEASTVVEMYEAEIGAAKSELEALVATMPEAPTAEIEAAAKSVLERDAAEPKLAISGKVFALETAKAVQVTGETRGLRKTRNDAISAGRAIYGIDAKPGYDFDVHKTAHGECHFGPAADGRSAPRSPMKAAKREKIFDIVTPAPKTKTSAKSNAKDGERAKRGTVGAERDARGAALLARKTGATIAELMSALSWNEPSARWWLTNVARKRMGLSIEREVSPTRGSVYRASPLS